MRMKIEELCAYDLLEKKELKDIHSEGYLLKHKKTGARVLLLSNDDENKVFQIGFKTLPSDGTGVPHILEHSVLCGSKKFPAKDPFVELVKGSLNTFLNAMTYPDKTVYPVASCNDKDFQNLMHVYLDAVFFPNIYNRSEIFRQEGWHYELESVEGDITYNGVVYNEMKGVFSSPEDLLDREILNSLFPDTVYGVESGGDPDSIPDLTYEQFLDFHKKYYHPSNSYLYLYGNMDMAEKLDWIDKEYFSKFEKMEVDFDISLQKPFEKRKEVEKQYSITQEESEKDKTYMAYTTVVDTSLNKELYLAFQILEYALLAAPGAPLKQALLDNKIGKDVMSTYENGIYQPFLSVIVKNANKEDKERFLELIFGELSKIVEEGMDEKALEAGINYYEFKYREADFGSYPKGLMYGLQAYDSWLYEESLPFLHLEALDTFRFLREKIGTGYYEELIKNYMIDNPHASFVLIEPKKGLTAKKEKEVVEKLRKLKNSLSKEQLMKMVEDTKELVRYQKEPSSPEDLAAIPILKREDIKKEAEPYYNKETYVGNTLLLWHDLHTNGIGYLTLLFDTRKVPLSLLPYMGILKAVLGFVDTKHYSYRELFHEINRKSGGMNCTVSSYANLKEEGKYKACFEVKAKTFYEKLDFVFSMIKEILFTSKIEDEKRLYEIIAMLKSRMQMSMTSSGHSVAAMRALSYGSNTAYFADLVGGMAFYRLLERLEAHFEEEKKELIANLQKLMHYIFQEENMMVDYTCDETGFSLLSKEIEALKPMLYKEPVEESAYEFPKQHLNEGFKTSAKVQYVAKGGNFIQGGLPYTGALKVLKHILGYDYLWSQVRVMGGAYGCMTAFSRIGDSYFVSYRDPNLKRTLEVYNEIPKYISAFTADEDTMTKYIIGTISDMDIPMMPAAKGLRSLTAYLNHMTYEDAQTERTQILNAKEETIRSLVPYVQAVLKQNQICVLGGEEKIQEEEDLFQTVENLFL